MFYIEMLLELLTLVAYLQTSFGYIEVIEERGIQETEFRLTCRHLHAHIAVLEASFTPTVDEEDHQVKNARVQRQEYKIRYALNHRCSGVNHCSFILHADCPGSKFWGPGEIYIKYACMAEHRVARFCNLDILIPEGGGQNAQGFITTPGYPKFYVGQSECRWRIRAPNNQRIELTLIDVSLNGGATPKRQCEDDLTVMDDDLVLTNTCKEEERAPVVESKGSSIEITVTGRTGSLVPKRGVLLYYRAIECPTPSAPADGYLVERNATAAVFMCCVGFVFPDTLKRIRILKCLQNTWDMTLPAYCVNIQNASHNVGEVKDHKTNMTDDSHLIDIVIPSILIAGLLFGNAIIVFIIYKYRKRKSMDIQEEELNTMVANQNVP